MKPCEQNQKALCLLAVDELPPVKADDLRAHLGTCPGCQQYFDQISSVTEELAATAGAMPEIEAPSGFHRRLMARLEMEPRPGLVAGVVALLQSRVLKWRIVTPAAAMVVVVVGWLLASQRSWQSTQKPVDRTASTFLPAVEVVPSFGNYRMLANRSFDALDRELTREAATAPTSAPFYAASSIAQVIAAD